MGIQKPSRTRRKYPDLPLVGVGALVMKDDKVLLVKRQTEPGKGLWSIPGGLVELGETIIEAVKREVKEETSLDTEIKELIGVFDSMTYDDAGRLRFHYVLIDYLAHPRGGSLKGNAEVADVRWVNINELGGYELTKILGKLLIKIGLITDTDKRQD